MHFMWYFKLKESFCCLQLEKGDFLSEDTKERINNATYVPPTFLTCLVLFLKIMKLFNVNLQRKSTLCENIKNLIKTNLNSSSVSLIYKIYVYFSWNKNDFTVDYVTSHIYCYNDNCNCRFAEWYLWTILHSDLK